MEDIKYTKLGRGVWINKSGEIKIKKKPDNDGDRYINKKVGKRPP